MHIARQLVSSIIIIASISGFSKIAIAESLMDKITASKKTFVSSISMWPIPSILQTLENLIPSYSIKMACIPTIRGISWFSII
jgi:hypothetical protein